MLQCGMIVKSRGKYCYSNDRLIKISCISISFFKLKQFDFKFGWEFHNDNYHFIWGKSTFFKKASNNIVRKKIKYGNMFRIESIVPAISLSYFASSDWSLSLASSVLQLLSIVLVTLYTLLQNKSCPQKGRSGQ
jgi:hypothetical protein